MDNNYFIHNYGDATLILSDGMGICNIVIIEIRDTLIGIDLIDNIPLNTKIMVINCILDTLDKKHIRLEYLEHKIRQKEYKPLSFKTAFKVNYVNSIQDIKGIRDIAIDNNCYVGKRGDSIFIAKTIPMELNLKDYNKLIYKLEYEDTYFDDFALKHSNYVANKPYGKVK